MYEHRQFTHESRLSLILTNDDRAPNRDDNTDIDDRTDIDDSTRSGSTAASQRTEVGRRRRQAEDRLQPARGCRPRAAVAHRRQVAEATAAAAAGKAVRYVSKRLPEPEQSRLNRARLLPIRVELWFSYTKLDEALQNVFIRLSIL